jgi:2-dehydropantoate 2-reductase
MKFAVVGSGAIGLYYGAMLAQAGEDVHFLMRSGFASASEDGIRVLSPDGDVHLPSPQVYESAGAIGTVDVVIVAIKATDNSVLFSLIPPLLGRGTRILTLQNGLGNDDLLAEAFGADRILGGLCFVCLTRDHSTCVRHFGHGALSLGTFLGGITPELTDLVSRFSKAGVETKAVENLMSERWRKLVWNIPFNGLAVSAGGVTVDRILADPELFQACIELMQEVIAAATALGHPIPTSFMDYQISRTRVMGPYQPSTLVDYLAGRPLEVEAIWGEPLRRAEEAGVPVPRLKDLYAELRRIALQTSSSNSPAVP